MKDNKKQNTNKLSPTISFAHNIEWTVKSIVDALSRHSFLKIENLSKKNVSGVLDDSTFTHRFYLSPSPRLTGDCWTATKIFKVDIEKATICWKYLMLMDLSGPHI